MSIEHPRILAYLVFRALALVMVLISVALLAISCAALFFNHPLSGDHRLVLLVGGSILVFAGIVGPGRIILMQFQIPLEVRKLILVQAIVLSLSGIVLILSGMIDTPPSEAWAYFLVGLLMLVSAFAGFFRLSTKIPPAFYIGELLSIVKSTGIAGDKNDSAADREFMRWTNGVRDGVPVGKNAPDGIVITMSGKSVLLSSYFGASDAEPLVLNFGSYTCPHYRKRIDELRTLTEKWQDKGVRFLTVYTAEAHTEDGWKLAHQYDNDSEYSSEKDFCFYYSRTIDERKKMAEWLVEKKHFEMPVVLDSVEDVLLRAYNTWPIRLYIIRNGKVAYCGDQGPFGYDPAAVNRALQELIKST